MGALHGYSYCESGVVTGYWNDDGSEGDLDAWTLVAPNLYLGVQPVHGLPDGVVFVVNCDMARFYAEPDCSYLHVPLVDGEELPSLERLHGAAELVNSLRELGPVYVHCRFGLNRSALVVALALIEAGGEPDTVIGHLRCSRHEKVLSNRPFNAYLRSLAVEQEAA
jgi:hypothetical protein